MSSLLASVTTSPMAVFLSHAFHQSGSGRRKRSAVSRMPMEMLESRVLLSSSHGSWVTASKAASLPSVGLAVTSPLSITPNSHTASGGFTPAQIKQAYSLAGISEDGTGQTIAIVDAYNDPTIIADLHTFSVTFGLPEANLTVVNQSGGTRLPSTDPAGPGNSWAMEIALDVEWAHAIAPGANIVLVEANSASNSDLIDAVDTARHYAGVSVVSMSWGSAESLKDLSDNSYFTTPSGHTGVTFITSSGDNGAYGDGGFTKAVDYPATSPNIISVGGTSLTTDSDGNYLSESGWGDGTRSGVDGGSGGGISKVQPQPSYQRGIVTQSTTARTLPDVSIVADPATGVDVIDSWDAPNSPWMVLGGTSLAAPMWGAIITLANQGRVNAGASPFSGTQALAAIYALPSSAFHDVTTGNNGFAAGPGYDLVTGRGTPIGDAVVAGLIGTAVSTPPVTPTDSSPTIGSFAATPAAVAAGSKITLKAKNVTDSGGAITSVSFYQDTDGIAGLNPATDTLVGTGKRSGSSWTLSTKLMAAAGGNIAYYAVATDNNDVTSSALTANITVSTPTMGGFTITPTSVSAAGSITLTASGVVEKPGKIKTVQFYRESNGTDGLQSDADTLVGTGKKRGSGYTLTIPAADLANGDYTYYAVATDAGGMQSSVATAPLTVVPVPANDSFANAFIIPSIGGVLTGTNAGASKEKKEPKVAKNKGGASIWYSWTAPASGTISLTTAGSDFNTELGVFTGTMVSKLKAVASNDNQSPDVTTSALTFNAVAGTTYEIMVDGFNGAMGNISLTLA